MPIPHSAPATWLTFSFSTLIAPDMDTEFTETPVELFDAVMTTLRRSHTPGGELHLSMLAEPVPGTAEASERVETTPFDSPQGACGRESRPRARSELGLRCGKLDSFAVVNRATDRYGR